MKIETIKEEFESRFKHYNLTMKKDSTGCDVYTDRWVQGAWVGWGAAINHRKLGGDTERERDLLAQAIFDAAVKSGIYRNDLPGMTGPQLLMACDDMAECIKSATA